MDKKQNPKKQDAKSENELRRLARIAVLKLNYRSLRDFELAMYRKAIADAEAQDKKNAGASKILFA